MPWRTIPYNVSSSLCWLDVLRTLPYFQMEDATPYLSWTGSPTRAEELKHGKSKLPQILLKTFKKPSFWHTKVLSELEGKLHSPQSYNPQRDSQNISYFAFSLFLIQESSPEGGKMLRSHRSALAFDMPLNQWIIHAQTRADRCALHLLRTWECMCELQGSAFLLGEWLKDPLKIPSPSRAVLCKASDQNGGSARQ